MVINSLFTNSAHDKTQHSLSFLLTICLLHYKVMLLNVREMMKMGNKYL